MNKENVGRLDRIEGILEEVAVFQNRTEKHLEDFAVYRKEHEESHKEIDILLKELAESHKELTESHKELAESHKELAESQKKTDEQIKKTDEQIKKTNEHVSGLARSWGYLAADLAEEALIGAMEKYKIRLTDIRSRLKHKDERGNILCEVDLVGTNGEVAVVVESKGRLTKNYVDAFITKLEKDVQKYFSECNRSKLYGVMAYFSTDNGIETYAHRKGLFVIQALSGMGKIKNSEEFQPHSFS